MKKALVFLMMLLSTSMAMAQFGSLKELKGKEENGGNGTSSSPENPSIPGQNAKNNQIIEDQLIEKCIVNGFFLVRQEYQLEDKTKPGSRYNWGDEQYFDYRVSFMVRLTNGFVIPDRIFAPWTDDAFAENKYTQYKDTHNPVFSKTSTLKLGQRGWKTESKVFTPKEESNLFNGLKFVEDDGWAGEGFLCASGYGKKEVYVVWMMVNNDQQDIESISFHINRIEVEIEQGKNYCKAHVPIAQYCQNAEGGIVLEPICKGIGQINFALVGVVDNYENEQPDDDLNQRYFDISLLDQNKCEPIDFNSKNSLTPTEESGSVDTKNDKKSSK